MSNGGYIPSLRSSRRGAGERQEAMCELMRRAPGSTWTRKQLHEHFRRTANKSLVDSAVQALLRTGRIEVAEPGLGGHGKASTFRAVVSQENQP